MTKINVKQRIFQNAWSDFKCRKKHSKYGYSEWAFSDSLKVAHRGMRIYLKQ